MKKVVDVSSDSQLIKIISSVSPNSAQTNSILVKIYGIFFVERISSGGAINEKKLSPA